MRGKRGGGKKRGKRKREGDGFKGVEELGTEEGRTSY